MHKVCKSVPLCIKLWVLLEYFNNVSTKQCEISFQVSMLFNLPVQHDLLTNRLSAGVCCQAWRAASLVSGRPTVPPTLISRNQSYNLGRLQNQHKSWVHWKILTARRAENIDFQTNLEHTAFQVIRNRGTRRLVGPCPVSITAFIMAALLRTIVFICPFRLRSFYLIFFF